MKRIIKIDIRLIILVSNARAELKENKNVLLKLGFLIKIIPKYILIMLMERKKISF